MSLPSPPPPWGTSGLPGSPPAPLPRAPLPPRPAACPSLALAPLPPVGRLLTLACLDVFDTSLRPPARAPLLLRVFRAALDETAMLGVFDFFVNGAFPATLLEDAMLTPPDL